jgi:transcriptional regulator with XRE-family HTH domain
MENIDKIFLEALNYFVSQSRSQTVFAARAGISVQYLNNLLSGRRQGGEALRRKIANSLGYQSTCYETFLDVGRAILKGQDPDSIEESWKGLTGEELKERGFLIVPFSDNMKLVAGSDKTIPITDDESTSKIIVHGPSLGRSSSRNLQAFSLGGNSMEPIIAIGSIVLADMSENESSRLNEGKIYIICWELYDRECSVKYLRWAEKPRSLLITSPNNLSHPPLIKLLTEVQIIGRVIWSWGKH